MKSGRILLPVSVLLAGTMAWSAVVAETPGPDNSPGVEQRELQRIDPDRFRAPKPLDFEIPSAPPMQSVPDAEFNVTSFSVSGNSVFDDAALWPMLEGYRGKVTFTRLLEAVESITEHYRSNGYIVARAYIPEQEVSNGIIDIVVLEGVLGDIQFQGDTPISRERSAKRMDRLVRNGMINEYDLEYGALLLNDLPGMSASVALQPGAETGLSDVVLDVKDEGTFDFALDYNNYGTPVTGEHRFGAQIGINNLFNMGDQISLRPIVSDSGDTTYGELGFNMPLFTPATRVGLRFSHLLSQLGEEFADLEIENTATTLGFDASHAFVRSRNKNIFATFTYENRVFERECGICKAQLIPIIEDADYNLDVVELGVSGDWRDERWGAGVNTWYAAVRNGLSDVEPVDAGITTPGADRIEGKFTSLRLGAQRLQRLTDVATLSVRLDTQFSSDDLDAAERISLGGPGAVRAYRPSEALGDSGFVVQTELRRQFHGISDRVGWLNNFEGYLLVDFGSSKLNDDENNLSRKLSNSRSGWGGGLRFSGGNEFYIDLVAATRLTDKDSLVDQPDDSKTNFWAQAVYWF